MSGFKIDGPPKKWNSKGTSWPSMNTPVSFAIWNRSILLDEKGYAELWTPDDYERNEMAQELASDPAKVDAMFAEMDTTKV